MKMEFKKLRIDDLIPASYNPRKKLKPGDSEFEKIKNSIKEFGYVDPVIVNKDRTVIGGHQRISVLKTLGFEEIDCVVIDIDKTKEKALNVALNKVSGFWDENLLADLLKDLEGLDYDLKFTGFDPPEIDELFTKLHDKDVKDDDYDVTKALEEAAFVNSGEIWQLGRHRIMCGDATKPEDVSKLMDGKTANLLVTDPPYNISYEGSNGLKIENDSMQDKDFYEFLLSAFKNMAAHLEPGGSAYVFHADTEGLNFRKAFIEAGFHLSGVCIWAKNTFTLGRSPYQWGHEPVIYGWTKGGKHRWYSDRSQSTIWNYDKPKKNDIHCTMKPIPLLCYPIKNSSQVNGIVLDTFCGSGSTIIACEQTDRVGYGMELDPKYASVIVRRYIEQVGSDNEVFLLQNGSKIKFSEIVKELPENH
jgi:DNA modification methylase